MLGGFGIDGCMSTLIGASFATNKLCFCITGDLAFFYDMNSLGCREIGPNVRILLINNNLGMTFKLSNHVGSQIGRPADSFIAAAGHNISANGIDKKHSSARAWAESLGFEYLCASSKTNLTQLKSASYRRMQRGLFYLNALRVKKTKEMREISSIPLMIVLTQKQGLKR